MGNATATATAASSNQQGGGLYYFILLGILFVAMYFNTIRPQNKRDKELKNLRDNLKIGDEIMTIGGIYGTVARINEDKITITSGSDKSKIEISKSAVSTVLNREIPAPKKDAKAAEEVSDEKVSPKKIKKLGKKSESEIEGEENTPKE